MQTTTGAITTEINYNVIPVYETPEQTEARRGFFNLYVRAGRVQKALDAFHDKLVARLGDYRWTIEGDKYVGYEIVAHSDGQRWTESRGKTPRKALFAWSSGAQVLRDNGVPIEP